MSNLKNIIDSFKIKSQLDTKIWDKNGNTYTLKKNIREKLLQTAYEFYDSLGVDVIISDITFTGSLANFNWSNFSDIDLHLIADYKQFNEEELPLYKELFLLKKTIFNDKHDITILNYEVELYVQDENEEHTSTGVYSVLNNEWIVEPKKDFKEIDKKFISNKSKQWMDIIDGVLDNISDEKLETAKSILKKYKDKLKKYRSCGLEKGGEFSTENLVFKVLRRNGYIEKLYDAANKLVDNKLSLKEDKVEDPKLSDEEKAKIVKPDVEELYKTLDSISSNIYQQESGNYSIQKEVESVQIALDILGYELPKHGVDGKFGPETAKAVNDFKKDNSMKLVESFQRKILTEGDIAGIDELAYNPVTRAGGTFGYGFNDEKKGPQNWPNHDTHLHIGFTNREVAIAVIEKVKELGLRPGENWYKGASGKVEPVHTTNSFHYRIFDGEPIVSAGLDVGDGQGKKRDKVTELIRWIYDTFEGKQVEKTPIVAFDNGRVSKKYEDRPFLSHIRDFANNPSLSLTSQSTEEKAFISPEMADNLILKLKEKNLQPEELSRYTRFKMDFSDVITKNDDEFYQYILRGIGAPISPSNLKFLYAWRQAESGKAKFNPFNTTYTISNDAGMCIYNCLKDGEGYKPLDCKTCPTGTKPGVKSYSLPQFGLEATVSTLRHKRYECIVQGLRNELPPDEIAKCRCLHTWGTKEGVSRVLASNKINPKPISGLS